MVKTVQIKVPGLLWQGVNGMRNAISICAEREDETGNSPSTQTTHVYTVCLETIISRLTYFVSRIHSPKSNVPVPSSIFTGLLSRAKKT